MKGLSALLATHLAQAEFAHLPAATIATTKRAILDGVGVMLAASGSSTDVLPFVNLARSQGGGSSTAQILGFGDRVGASMAALANGAMAHALDFEDAFDAAPVHPNASLLPAALAIAQSHGPVSGREFITAVAIGCDLVCRLALALRQPMEVGGWYPPPILGAFGATAAACRLLHLKPTQFTDAFSLLMCQNSCPGEIKYSADTVIRAVREAFPAQAAVTSALLAASGVRGFDAPLEGTAGFYQLFAAGHYDAHDLLDELGTRNWIEQLSFKQWPCCRGTHAYIEIAQTLRQQHGFAPTDIAAIRIIGGEVQQMLCEPFGQKRAPRTVIDAKFSLPFTIACALLHDEVRLGSFTDETLRDERLLALAQHASFEASPDWGRDRADAGELRITLNDGRRLQAVVPHALGNPSRPLSDAALRAKFIDCAARAATPLPLAAAWQLADRILSLECATDAGAAIAVRDYNSACDIM
jgi:2-methylcitrate dehydratase PrpD